MNINNKLILTPNRRLAAFLINKYNKQQALKNKQVWETLAIDSLEEWLSQLWQTSLETSANPPKPVLTKVQQQMLWEQIIQNSNVGVELLHISATAKNALQAWKFLRQWQVSIDKLAAYAEYSSDTAAFYSWLQEYLQWLEAHDYTDFNLMVDHLIASVPELIAKLPAEICLIGVDDMKPQEQQFFSLLTEHGVVIRHETMVKPGAIVSRSGFANMDLELEAAAIWASKIIADDAQQITGIVVPQLEIKRKKVARIFGAKIEPQFINISAPASLASYMLIDTALLILQLAKPIINYEAFSALLRAPYIQNSEAELHIRARLDRQLRDKVEAKNSWEILSRIIASSETSINEIINNFSNAFTGLHGKHGAEYWAQEIQTLLSIWGWPGDRGLTIEERDLLSCWQDLLHDYCQLTRVLADHSYSQALQYIERLANETPFLPAETGTTRVHVLGVLEAAGIYFDQLWVSGMDRNNWPPEAAPNPFIPLELQRQVDMPRSSPQRELKVARRLTTTLKQGAKHTVIFSYPQRIEDQITHPSNLIADLPELKIASATAVVNIDNIILEKINDQQGSSLENFQIKGGTSILKTQAQCPFKAYAEHRLGAQALTEPQLILTAAHRGNIVHEVMEGFWQECQTQERLLSLLPQALVEILTGIIKQVLIKQQRKLPNTLTANYIQLEKTRLLNLIPRWLDYEKTREPFTVQQIEQKILVSVGPLSLNLRVDRIDKLSDQSVLIIDYKTGAISLNSWYAERIIEPQLPLYTLQFDAGMVAVAIADMRVPEPSFKTIKPEENWSALVASWRKILAQTAIEFAQGQAKVDPYSPQICRTCKLQPLCRIYDY